MQPLPLDKEKSGHRWILNVLTVFSVAAFAPNAGAEDAPSSVDLLGNVKITTPLKLQNADKTGQLKAVKIEMGTTKISAQAELDLRCPKPEITTNQSVKGQYLERVLFGYGTLEDSFSAQTVFENKEWTISGFKGRETVMASLPLFDGTEYGASPVDLLLARAHKFVTNEEKRLSFFQNAQRYTVDYPLRLEMICRDYVRNTVTERLERGARQSYVQSRNIPVPVRYVGDKALKGSGLVRLKMRGSIASPVAPKITRFELEPPVITLGPKNLRGVCPQSANFKVRISGEEQGLFRLLIKSDRQILQTSEEQRFRGRDMEVGFSLPLDQVKGVSEYEQNLRKITVEIQGKSKAQQALKIYPVRRRSEPYFWQYSCISQ